MRASEGSQCCVGRTYSTCKRYPDGGGKSNLSKDHNGPQIIHLALVWMQVCAFFWGELSFFETDSQRDKHANPYPRSDIFAFSLE